jgi:hypothetical protein
VSNSKSQFDFLSKLKAPETTAADLGSLEREGASPHSAGRPKNKAVDPRFVKLTAYVPRSLHAALKMAMARDATTDQSQYVEDALKEWLAQRHPNTLEHSGYNSTTVES